MLEGLQEGLLNHVFGIFPIVRDVLGNSEEFAIVSLYELLESSNIPILAGMDKIQLIACHGVPLRVVPSLQSYSFTALRRTVAL